MPGRVAFLGGVLMARAASASVCTGSCTEGTGGGNKRCKFTARLNPYASDTGLYTFDECDGDMPTLGLEQNVTYTFDQSHITNWYHPLGFAYFADGAHKGVDELEPGITQSSSSCADDNTCQAPMYYLGDEYTGGDYDNHGQATPVGGDNFGLDDYEPLFFYPRDDWSGMGNFSVQLTVTDLVYTKDLFYFCHIHNNMSGRIKVLDSSGSEVNSDDTPATGYSYPEQSDFDSDCGTYGLDAYQSGSGMCDDTFVCGDGSSTTGSFGECLKAMDCAMDYNMRVTLSETSAAETFMHQMIPHHRNAVNMAKALLKDGSLTSCEESSDDGNADCGIEGMLWGIINVQNNQINTMEAWLSDNGYAATDVCDADDDSSDDGDDDDDYNASLATGVMIVGILAIVVCAMGQVLFAFKFAPTK